MDNRPRMIIRGYGGMLLILVGMTGLCYGRDFPAELRLLAPSVGQVVMVNPGASGWERHRGKWVQAIPSVDVSLGRNGIANPGQKREGDGRTPSGIYPLRRAFGKSATLDTHLNYRQVTTRDVWIDEPASPSYNQWLIEDTSPIVSHETLLRSDHQYDAAIVVEYNTDPIVPGMGSAIFMHIWRSPTSSTAGCVAMDAGDLSRFLKWLNPQKKPVVMIR